MSTVLLFGGSGFIGRQVKLALEAGPGLTLHCPGRDRYDLLGGDPAGLRALLAEVRPDVVVNCTGRLDGTGHELVLANTVVTAALLDAMAAIVPGARLVRLGSASEYGVMPHGVAVSETHPTAPVSDYGVSHLAGTGLVQVASAADPAVGRVDGVVLRLFNPIGPGLHEANMLGRAVDLLRRALHEGADSVTLGPLDAYRDFVDVRDVADAVRRAVLADRVTERVLNVGSGTAVTAREAVHLLAEEAGFTGEILERGAGPARSSTVHWACADITRAREVLGWSPRYSLADSIKGIWTG